jgi:pilus assembly protein TadC
MRLPFHLFTTEQMDRIGKRFRWLGRKLAAVFPFVKYDMVEADIKAADDNYLAVSAISALLLSLLFLPLAYLLLLRRFPDNALALAGGACGFLFVLFLGFYISYPSIRAKTIAVKINTDLLYALRDLLVQVQSGISLYDAMVNIAAGNYGNVSKEFGETVREINSGVPEEVALERMALRTKSDYLKKAVLQILNAISGGASLKDAVKTTITTLENHQINRIRDYASKLNFLALLYMLTSAAMPSIGVTFLIILSTFSGAGINEQTIFSVIGASFVLQMMLIGYIRGVRPVIY